MMDDGKLRISDHAAELIENYWREEPTSSASAKGLAEYIASLEADKRRLDFISTLDHGVQHDRIDGKDDWVVFGTGDSGGHATLREAIDSAILDTGETNG